MTAFRMIQVKDGVAFLAIFFPLQYTARDEISRRQIPYMGYPEATALILDMSKGKRSFIYNDETWGLGHENLKEFAVTNPIKFQGVS